MARKADGATFGVGGGILESVFHGTARTACLTLNSEGLTCFIESHRVKRVLHRFRDLGTESPFVWIPGDPERGHGVEQTEKPNGGRLSQCFPIEDQRIEVSFDSMHKHSGDRRTSAVTDDVNVRVASLEVLSHRFEVFIDTLSRTCPCHTAEDLADDPEPTSNTIHLLPFTRVEHSKPMHVGIQLQISFVVRSPGIIPRAIKCIRCHF